VSADAPAPPDRTRRAVILATVGIVVILGLAVFIAIVVVPVWEVRKLMGQMEDGIPSDPSAEIRSLGSKEQAVAKFKVYLACPAWIATRKERVLTIMGHCGEAASPVLLRMLRSNDWQLRAAAAFALGRIESREAVTALIDLLDDDHERVREGAVWSLGVGIRDRRAISPLRALLDDESPHVREWAARGLGRFYDYASVPRIIKLLKDEDTLVRRSAVQALDAICDERAIEPLKAALKDEDAYVRTAAAEALKRIRVADAEALKKIRGSAEAEPEPAPPAPPPPPSP
jgi:hypothetical protein